MRPRIRIPRLLPIAFFAFITLSSIVDARAHCSPRASAQSEIESVLKMQQDAWNHGDIESFLKGYWRSPNLTFSGSDGTLRGWNAVLQRYKTAYPDRAAMGQLTFSDLEYHELGSHAYLVLGKWHLDRAGGAIGGVFTLVFQHFPVGWRIIHDHTSLVPAKNQ